MSQFSNKNTNTFEKICDFENLHSAYLKARRGKRYREILKFGYNAESNLFNLRRELLGAFTSMAVIANLSFAIQKKRHIKAAPFRDRVAHHAVCNIIEPVFEKGFIFDSYACRRKRGHKAVKNCKFYQVGEKPEGGLGSSVKIYCLKCDVSKYFDNA